MNSSAKPSVASIQLPDLPSFCNAIELRANSHCRPVTQASQKWLKQVGLGCPAEGNANCEALSWGAMKVGLLAALCYPRADATQLRLSMDVLSLMLWTAERLVASNEANMEKFDAVVQSNVFLHLSDRLLRLSSKSPIWYDRFDRSLYAFRTAQVDLARNRGVVPDLETYIELRRDSSGLKVVFDMIEYTHGFILPEDVVDDPTFRKMVENACNVIAWSEDIVSYSRDNTKKNMNNLITVLMVEKSMSVQAALEYSGTLVQQSIDAFLETERIVPCWDKQATREDIRLYVQGLRDCIAGSINWFYETERYFGDKGEQVRSYGWVFLE
ncbi:hypothetical protein SERLA73DRAFT_92947 [Serpula lacrymans var. lacrymans S7.3]|uniref:Terpene synthase n=2 Tax=Serpula lacrymans var. lacrymans TaxID=341189 RepID=F8Q3G2_SERL3|nr:putative terpene cyclase [Serpula lacrymans var. lacrymans S7.9]EGN97723.1 hypothetical protein SERLA73DRAFT_92947 [Serpula lacrymans var. lacrymans S7.3]EGO23313.1 putative terpene cyclase [Serpula lacrymans var. lacrymans S7.9]